MSNAGCKKWTTWQLSNCIRPLRGRVNWIVGGVNAGYCGGLKHDYEWVERADDGTKRIIRVSLPGGGKIVWLCRARDDEPWIHNMKPTAEAWEYLEKKVRGRYNRRRAGIKDVELVVAMRGK